VKLKSMFIALAVTTAFVASTFTAQADVKVKLEAFVTGVNTPLAMVQPTGDDRKFVIEQNGRVKIINAKGELLGTPFLDIRNRIVDLFHDFDERGLLGLTFHPDFKNNGKFYVAYSGQLNYDDDLGKMLWWSHSNTVSEFTVSKDDPNVANPNSERVITVQDWPQFNHNGHWIDFGSDGMLYIAMGDGGYANDWGIGHNVTEGNGQDMTTWLGKVLRIDVNKSSGDNNYSVPSDNPFVGKDGIRPEIWASGFRNPWRCSFDTANGKLFCADVQQNSFEEVDIVEKGGNYGWRRMEGTHCFDYQNPDKHPGYCNKTGLTLPIIDYNHCSAQPKGCMGTSITGGYVYHGSNKAWDGRYIFGDWSKGFAAADGQIFVASNSGGKWSYEKAAVTNMSGNLPYILAFAQDASGEVYALTSYTTGPNGGLDTIYKVVPAN